MSTTSSRSRVTSNRRSKEVALYDNPNSDMRHLGGDETEEILWTLEDELKEKVNRRVEEEMEKQRL